MKKCIVSCIACGIALVVALPAVAQPKQGFGIFAGLSNSNFSEPDFDVDSSGVSFGVDFQIPVQDRFSLSPFFITSSEEGDDIVFVDPFFGTFTFETEFEFTIFGLQARYWIDNLFIGGHIANYDLEITLTERTLGISVSDSESDIGFGAVVGWEADQSFFVTAQFDTVEIGGTDVTGFRFHLGWRFSTM